MVLQYEKQEMERMEACRKIKMDAAQGAVLKNITQIEHGNEYCSLIKYFSQLLQKFQKLSELNECCSIENWSS